MTAFAINEKSLPKLLKTRCSLIKLDKTLTEPVQKDFLKWYQCNGADYVVQKFKTIKQIVINYAAYDAQLPKDIWMKKTNKFLLQGHYGRLQKIAHSGSNGLKQVLTLLNVYTLLVQNETTDKSVEKFRKAVETPGPDSSDRLKGMIRLATRRAVLKYHLDETEVQYAGPYEVTYTKKPHQEKDFLQQVERVFRCRDGIDLIDLPVVFNPMLNCLGFKGYRYYSEPLTMGKIFRIPSPGLKDRWVCDFYKPLEHCLKPLGQQLYSAVSKLPWDITFDETKCYKPIQDALSKQQVLHAYDLSSATDRFPWDLQYNVLRTFNLHSKFQEMVSLYDLLIKTPAEMPDGSLITWKHGQPLGAYPSFATFTLTHGLLLYALNAYEWDNDFFVHGDDVVILNSELATKYYNIMQELQVDISLFKSVVSNRLTEINSKVITADAVLTIPKWKPITRKNALSQIKNWGTRIVNFLNIKSDELDAILQIAQLPECLGGAGVNPYGFTLDDRMNGMEDLYCKDKNLGYEGSSRQRVLRRFKSNPRFYNLLEKALKSAERFDQKRLSDIPESLQVYRDFRDLDILGKNLYSLNSDLKIPIESPSHEDAIDEVYKAYLRLNKSKWTRFFRKHS